jgi:hypothetical protein
MKKLYKLKSAYLNWCIPVKPVMIMARNSVPERENFAIRFKQSLFAFKSSSHSSNLA